ncbi:flagellar assembly protein T N-terminal domain-containing protein [Gallaecimonas pentaromativorans]|uniref:flagellar assembly protein T N-terminal domain-containing protein n=1 Tax=Gallaecimonas pentaromativorans TaxID=584787 RepID=UPI003A8DBD95
MRPLLLAALLLPHFAQAAWYTGTGTAPVINSNKELARQQATRAAIRDAVLKAGASVSIVNDVDNGSLTGNAFQVRAKGHITQLQRLEEYSRDDKVSVTVRADIWNDGAVCDGRLTSKSVVVAPLTLSHPEQAIWGGLEDLPQAVSARIFEEMTKAQADFLPKSLLSAPLAVNPARLEPHDRQELQSLAEQKQAQYLVLGSINNLTLGKIEGGLLSSDQLIRQYGMTLYLIDGISGLPILSKRYESRTLWPFAVNAQLDVQSDQLWQSAYGLEISRLVRAGIEDMSEALKCVHPKTRVIRVEGGNLDVAMGGRQGVRIGDVFRLSHQYNFTDDGGIDYSSLNDENSEFEVVKVYPDHSQLSPLNGDMPMNIQIRDLVQLDSFWE